MSYDTIPANLFPLFIETGVDTWTQIGGINTISLNTSKQDADTTTFDNAGWTRSTVVSRGLTVTGSGYALYDATTGAKDPGQAACEAAADEIGAAAEATFRIHTPGTTAYEFTGTVTCTPFGGGVNDVASWSVEITVTAPASEVSLA